MLHVCVRECVFVCTCVRARASASARVWCTRVRVRAERCGSTHSAGDGAARALQACGGAGGSAAVHTDSCSENAIGAHWIWRAGGGAVSSVSSTMRAAVGIMRSCGFMVVRGAHARLVEAARSRPRGK